MGPGAGTAIVDGVALGFANVVAPGPVGRGRGGRHRRPGGDGAARPGRAPGVSRCYGTGGRDLKDEVGAITALDAIARLAADDRAPTSSSASPSRPRPEWPSGCCARWPAAGTPAAACMVGGGVEPVDGVHLAGHARGGGARPRARLAGPPRRRRGTPRRRLGRRAAPCAASSRAARSAARRRRSWPSASATVHSNAPAGRARQAARRAPSGHAVPGPGRGGVHPRPAPPDDRPRGARRAAGRGGGRPRRGRPPARRRAGLRQPPRPGRRCWRPPIRAALAARPQLAVVGYVLGTEADPQVRSRQEATLRGGGRPARPRPTPPPPGSPRPSPGDAG